MDKGKLIEKAKAFYQTEIDHNADDPMMYRYMADFHIAMSAERDAENEKLWEALDKFRELLNRN